MNVQKMMEENKIGKVLLDVDLDNRMTGDEIYPILADRSDGVAMVIGTELARTHIFRSFKGYLTFGDCLSKNKMTFNIVERLFPGKFELAKGSMRIFCKKTQCLYGFNWNPPLEYHVWIQKKENHAYIIDMALPGVILRGSESGDDKGFFIEGMKPFAYIGHTGDDYGLWYHTMEVE